MLGHVGQLAKWDIETVGDAADISPRRVDAAGLDVGYPGRVNIRPLAKRVLAHVDLKAEGADGLSKARLGIIAAGHWGEAQANMKSRQKSIRSNSSLDILRLDPAGRAASTAMPRGRRRPSGARAEGAQRPGREAETASGSPTRPGLMGSAGTRRFDRDAARPAPPERSEGRGSAATGARGRVGERVADTAGAPGRTLDQFEVSASSRSNRWRYPRMRPPRLESL
jgi:hypothetical protein